MKKTLAALAVLGAFAGSAMAADVTVYGIVDVGVKYVHSDPDDSTKATTDSFTMAAGNQSGNRFGLKGVEDLGNGVSVGFVLENGFAIDDGTLGQSNRLFGREAILFVRSAFGELSFGRVGALDSANGSYGLLGYLSPFGASWAGAVEFSTFYVGGARMDNTVTYKYPNFAGFNAYAQYSFGMNTKDKFGTAADHNDDTVAPVEGKSGDTRYAALGATYVAGPFNLAASAALYNWSSTEYTDKPDNGYTLTAGGYYNCGFAKTYLSAQYFDNMYKTSSNYKDGQYAFASVGLSGETFKGWAAQAGFDMPLAGGTAMLAFGYADTESANGADGEQDNDNEFTRWGTSVGYTYSLSKRTNVYGVAGYYQDKQTLKKVETKPETTTVYVGMRHSF